LGSFNPTRGRRCLGVAKVFPCRTTAISYERAHFTFGRGMPRRRPSRSAARRPPSAHRSGGSLRPVFPFGFNVSKRRDLRDLWVPTRRKAPPARVAGAEALLNLFGHQHRQSARPDCGAPSLCVPSHRRAALPPMPISAAGAGRKSTTDLAWDGQAPASSRSATRWPRPSAQRPMAEDAIAGPFDLRAPQSARSAMRNQHLRPTCPGRARAGPPAPFRRVRVSISPRLPGGYRIGRRRVRCLFPFVAFRPSSDARPDNWLRGLQHPGPRSGAGEDESDRLRKLGDRRPSGRAL